MTALVAIIAMDEPLKAEPLFVVEPPDKLLGSEIERRVTFRSMLRHLAPNVASWGSLNAGQRGPKAQAQARKEAMVPGVFDEQYDWNYGLAYLEWKDGKGKLSQHQIAWGNERYRRGFHVACVRTPEFALQLLAEWGAPVRLPVVRG